MDDDELAESIEACIAANSKLVESWVAGAPGSWGALAARAVLIQRDRLGRRLTDHERRAVWAMLWQRLNRI
jgi:hypothetical protein